MPAACSVKKSKLMLGDIIRHLYILDSESITYVSVGILISLIQGCKLGIDVMQMHGTLLTVSTHSEPLVVLGVKFHVI